MFPLVQMHLLVLLVFVLFAAPSGGGWSDWNVWASCSVTCGGGSQTRNRTCTNPPPRSHLINCLGSRLPQSRLCNTNHCPVHGGWSDWKEWSHCTKAIGGIQIRTRECVNPKPRYGGKPCSGNRVVVRGCGNTSSCHEAFPVRFRTKESPSLGTMEIFRNKTWEKLCTAIWNDAEENLTCRAMGYFNNGPDENSTGQEGRNGSNTTVNRICKSFTNDCVNNSEDDLQKCKVPVRLNGAKIEYGGRVEVFYRGTWGKICRKEWGLGDVKVVCNQLGFRGALAEFVASEVKEENIPYLMSGVSCSGHESDLASCKRTDGDYDCPDDKGAQALCEPKNREVLEKRTFFSDIGSSETFKCSLKNDTSMTKWYIKGAGASLYGGRIKKSGGTLTINNVRLSDGGTYECRGLKYTRFYTIYVNAIFKDTPIRQTLISGTSAIVKCGAVGTPIPQFDEWKKDGNKTLDKGRFTHMSNGNLRVYPARPEDQGNYTCAMKQNKGDRRVTTKFRIIHVSVVVPPNIQLSEPKLTVREGDNVSLTCIINEGSPTPKIKWTKDETSKDETKNVLHLREVTAEDEGRYTCKAENEGGFSNDSTFVTVDVPPKVNPKMMNQSVPLSSAFALECIVGGKPTPKINWTNNGRHLANNSTALRISHVTFDDAGQYECSAENRAGKIRTSFWMDVTVSPQVYVSPTNQTVPEGKAANISCKVTSGVPKPSLSWNFQGRRLPEEVLKREIENGSVLQMQNTTKGMEGTYKCVAKNKANEKIATSTLHVLEKPTAEVSPKFFPPFLVGDDLTLTCKVSGEKVEVKWKKDGSPVTSRARISQNGDKSTLVIKNVETVDSGDYSCEAHNEAGFISSAVEIKVRVVRFVDDQKVKWYHIVAPTAAVIFLILGGWYIRKRRMLAMAIARARSVHQEEQAFELEELNHEVDEWEITRDRITNTF